MDAIQWDATNELLRLRAHTDQLWDDLLGKISQEETDIAPIAFLPDIDLVETLREYRIYMSLPGLIEEDLQLRIYEQTVTISGERQPPYDPGHAVRRVGEWRYGFFQRQIHLPTAFCANSMRASCDSGVLVIILPRLSIDTRNDSA